MEGDESTGGAGAAAGSGSGNANSDIPPGITDEKSIQMAKKFPPGYLSTSNEQDLDREFHKAIVKLQYNVDTFGFREKTIATEWMIKLRNVIAEPWEKIVRNLFLEYFSNCTGDVFKSPPFNKNLPREALLQSHIQMLPYLKDYWDQNETEDASKKFLKLVKELFSISEDFTHFLCQMPVPRDGAIFIMRVFTNKKQPLSCCA
ncbi:uncharacterized protein LOC119672082 [Teleopsis dalmanni]|uniref:uncharacterized protein LOC119662998 n=1 Tax=Teleopsis dalmanni TaxID=139649 RepID=UPI0018CFE6E8|nr:uncharacterized protein LOC119662998 [Teleopsis dalmanni]XP_037938969.1 uncharacterized protein LOC119672082 [Teleopsis dalmanni]